MAKGIFGFLVGKTPKVPRLGEVSPEAVQKETVAGNLAALPGAENIASEANQFSQEELQKALNFFQPGALAQINKNIGAQLRGEINPEDTRTLIGSAVAAGYGRGFGGSFQNLGGIGGKGALLQYGLSQRAVQQQGFQNFLNLAQSTKTPQFDFSSMFLTVPQRLNFEENRAEQEFNRNWLEAQVRAAPHPAGAFTTQLVLTLAGSAGKALGAAVCWVARECYGINDPKWMLFQDWLLTKAPPWFRNLYIRFGERFARMIRPFPRIKAVIRRWMDSRIKCP